VLAVGRILALPDLLTRGDRPSRLCDDDHRRDAVVVAEVQPLRSFAFAVDLHVRHAAEFRDEFLVRVAGVDRQNR
jgi:hypothetical protein